MESRVKSTKFDNQQMTVARSFFWQSLAAYVFTGSSISFHNIALFLFNNKIWLNQWKNIIQHWSRSLPVVYWSRKLLLASPSIARVFMAAEYILEPYNQFLIAAGYFKHAMPLITISVLSVLSITNIYASFSVNKTSKVCDFCDRMISFKVNSFSHELPFDNYYTVINEEVHAERLNEKALYRDAIV